MASTDHTALKEKLGKQFQAAQDAQRGMRADWDDHESLFLVRTAAKEVSTGQLSTQIIERSARVMAQMPTGKVSPMSKKDAGKTVLMNLALTRYILPNATAQHDPLVKLRMVNQYSHVYSYMPVLYDLDVRDDYVGPDFWLISPRNYFPQQGRISANDCDYVFVSTFMSVEDLRDKMDDEDWDTAVIKDVLEQVEKGTVPSARTDANRMSTSEAQRQEPFTDTNQVEVITRYQRGKKGKWTSFLPDFDNQIVRNIPNQHPLGKIPVVVKLTNPLLDTFYNLTDTERAKYLQIAQDTLLNVNLMTKKMRALPPLKISKQANVVNSSIRYQPGAKWLMDDVNGVANHPIPSDDNSFATGFQTLQSSLINQFGSTTTEVSQDAQLAEFGKTPEALKQRASKESVRDNLDRFFQEKFTEELFEGLINLLNFKGKKAFDFHIFDEEIAQIVQTNPDVLEVYDEPDVIMGDDGKPSLDYSKSTVAKVTLGREDYQSDCGYKYIIDAGSSMQVDDAEEHTRTQEVMMFYLQSGGMLDKMLAQKGKRIEVDELFKRWLISGGTKDWDKILTDLPQAPQMSAPAQGLPVDPATGQPLPGQPPLPPAQHGVMPASPAQPVTPQQPPIGPIEDAQLRAIADQILGGQRNERITA